MERKFFKTLLPSFHSDLITSPLVLNNSPNPLVFPFIQLHLKRSAVDKVITPLPCLKPF